MKKYEDSSLEKIMKVMMEYNNSWDKEEFVRENDQLKLCKIKK